eukprot:355323-Chlamydomonas_euryale.AAC.2
MKSSRRGSTRRKSRCARRRSICTTRTVRRAACCASDTLRQHRALVAAPTRSRPRRAGSGTIDVKELRMAMESLGQHPTDEDLYLMISQV